MTKSIEDFVAQRATRWLNFTAEPPAEPTATTGSHVRDAVISAMGGHECDHYTRRPGIAALANLIAERLAAKDLVVDPNDSVVITGGATETRYVALAALATGKTVYVTAAEIARYQAIADLIDATLVPLTPDTPLPETANALLLVTAPAGLAAEWLGQLTTWATAANMTVIVDEIDQPLLTPESGIRPLAGLPGMAEHTLTLGGFADAPGLAGWQVAWFAGPKPLASAVAKLKQAMTICSPAPGQFAALAATQGVES